MVCCKYGMTTLRGVIRFCDTIDMQSLQDFLLAAERKLFQGFCVILLKFKFKCVSALIVGLQHGFVARVNLGNPSWDVCDDIITV